MNRNTVIDYVRGVAVLMVLLIHWRSIGMNSQAEATLLHLSVVPESNGGNLVELFLHYWSAAAGYVWPLSINFASGGVLLFFLVSGFCIPMSVEKYSPAAFLIRRAFRLLPTLWIAIAAWFLLNLLLRAVGYASAPPFTVPQVFANMLLVHDWLWLPHIDLSFWTLLVEVKFYVAMAALTALSGRITLYSIAGLTGFLLFLSVPFLDLPGASDYAELLKLSGQSGYYWVFYFYRVLNNVTPYLVYMLIGTVFFLFHQERITAGAAFVSCTALFALFATAFLISPTGYGQIYYVEDGLKALVLFTLAMYADKTKFMSGRLPYLAALFRFLGKISYPLYLMHGLFGMSLIYALWAWSGHVNGAIFVGGLTVFMICMLLNRYIEEPTQKLGPKFAEALYDKVALALTAGSKARRQH